MFLARTGEIRTATFPDQDQRQEAIRRLAEGQSRADVARSYNVSRARAGYDSEGVFGSVTARARVDGRLAVTFDVRAVFCWCSLAGERIAPRFRS
jgi:Helix-turn-helix domain of resolvase